MTDEKKVAELVAEFGGGRVRLHGTPAQADAFWGALLEAQRRVVDQPHDAKAEAGDQPHDAKAEAGGRYEYTSAEAVIGETRRCLNEQGLVSVAYGVPAIDQDGHWLETLTLVRHVGEDGAGGATLEITGRKPVLPHRGMALDKAVCAALTNDLHYTSRGLTLMARPDKAVAPIDGRDDDDALGPSRRPGGKPPRQQDRRKAGESNRRPSGPPAGQQQGPQTETAPAAEMAEIQQALKDEGRAIGCSTMTDVWKLDAVVRLTQGTRPQNLTQWRQVLEAVREIRARRESTGNPWDRPGPWMDSQSSSEQSPDSPSTSGAASETDASSAGSSS